MQLIDAEIACAEVGRYVAFFNYCPVDFEDQDLYGLEPQVYRVFHRGPLFYSKTQQVSIIRLPIGIICAKIGGRAVEEEGTPKIIIEGHYQAVILRFCKRIETIAIAGKQSLPVQLIVHQQRQPM